MDIVLIPLAGFLGSFHCAAMCGPFAGFTAAGAGPRWKHQVAYQAGRLTSYLGLGVMAGLLGQTVLFAAGFLQAQRYILIALGFLMIGAGVWHYLPKGCGQGTVRRKVSGLMRGMPRLQGPEGAALIGLMSALLPCGYLYAFVTVALATANPFQGFLVMGGFWLGTVPMLLGAALITQTLSQTMLSRLSRMAPAVLILMGVLAVWAKSGAFPGGDPTAHCLDLLAR